MRLQVAFLGFVACHGKPYVQSNLSSEAFSFAGFCFRFYSSLTFFDKFSGNAFCIFFVCEMFTPFFKLVKSPVLEKKKVAQ